MSFSLKKGKNKSLSKLQIAGFVLIVASFVILFLTFLPVIEAEISYFFYKAPANYKVDLKANREDKMTTIVPVDPDFNIIIPKININAPIIANVDPNNSKEYQKKLAKGVAQAKGSSFPENDGKMFLFAHSASDFFRASHYNAIFYLTDKLERGDKIYIFKNQNRYIYAVSGKKIVSAGEVSYLQDGGKERRLTLMTCWPPGTTLKRLIIEAEMISSL